MESFKVQSRMRAHPWLFPLVFLVPLAIQLGDVPLGGNIKLSMALILLLLMLFTAIPGRLHVGTDGVLITWLGTKRFIGFSEISSAKAQGGGVVGLHLKVGGIVRIPAGLQILIVITRLNEAMEAYRRGGAVADIASLLRRGERPMEDWMDALDRGRRECGAPHRACRAGDVMASRRRSGLEPARARRRGGSAGRGAR